MRELLPDLCYGWSGGRKGKEGMEKRGRKEREEEREKEDGERTGFLCRSVSFFNLWKRPSKALRIPLVKFAAWPNGVIFLAQYAAGEEKSEKREKNEKAIA
jgi:hypothetical protein